MRVEFEIDQRKGVTRKIETHKIITEYKTENSKETL